MLRHASAGERLSDPSRDIARALDPLGRAQAAALPTALSGFEIERLLSSPLRRCVETLGPLSRTLGVPVEERRAHEPRASKREIAAVLRSLPDAALVCTHREVFETLFDGAIQCEKGGAWVLERRAGKLVPVEYLPPPPVADRSRRRRAALV